MNENAVNISVFFPAYNEAANLERLTVRTVETLRRTGRSWEIIIVDDGSGDQTPQVAEQLAAAHPGVKYIRHRQNQGYGGAVKTGLKASRGEWIFFTDGDGQFDTAEIELLLPHTDQADFIAGYRIKRRDNFLRLCNAFAWGLLVKTLFGLHGKVRDIDCAFKLFQRRIVDQSEFKAAGAMISTELLARARKMGYVFKEVGVHHYPRTAGRQTGANIKVIMRAFKELFTLYRQLK